MNSPRRVSNWRILADLIAAETRAFEFCKARINVGFMHDDHQRGRFTRNPSPFWGLTLLRSAPAFLARPLFGPIPQFSVIPVTSVPTDRHRDTMKNCGLPKGATRSKRTDHV